MSMMTTGLNTKNWSSSPQESSLERDSKNYAGVGETGVPDGKDLGQVLNEVADPNYIPPEKMKRVGNNNLDKDAFFKLMLAQIKNQDPVNPMKSDQMAAQLAQFTSLEQLTNINEKLDGLTKAQTPMSQYQALNFIGKSIGGDTSKLIRAVGDKNHDLRFTLPKEASKVVVNVKNQEGETVRTFELANLKKGENKLAWNGLDRNGSPTRAGDYYMEATAEDAKGAKIAVQTSFKGKVTGVNYTSDGVVLLAGDQSIRLRDVSKIEESDIKADQGVKDGSAQDPALQTLGDKKDNKVEGAKPGYTGNLGSIDMSPQVMSETNMAQETVRNESHKAAQGQTTSQNAVKR